MVGDCASVGETLIHYAPADIRYKHLARTRSVYSKTLGIALRILLSSGDVYHVHYGLQDHFLTKVLKRRPTICHLHGSDLRNTINGPYGWIVRTNLRTANKVIVAVPDIYRRAKSYRADAEYFPNPVNLDTFKPAPFMNSRKELRVFFASALSFAKGAQYFIDRFAGYQRENPGSVLELIRYGKDQLQIIGQLRKQGIKYKLYEPVPHDEMPQLYHNSDIVVTDFKLGYLHLTSLEAMACNRPVLQYIDEKLYSFIRAPLPPVMRISKVENVDDSLCRLADQSVREKQCAEQLAYVRKYHDPNKIGKRMADIYHEVIDNIRT
jgi:glycosyltransferase involved in cell wall biosynthesis